MPTVLAITPPFTQLNTPYPATAYIKGFLNTKSISCYQADLGLEVILKLYSKQGFIDIFKFIEQANTSLSSNAARIIALKDRYIHTIEPVISFLQGHDGSLVHLICNRGFLPEASRFDQLETYHTQAFGKNKSADEAKHLSTLYLEDMSDLIKECVDPHFGFSRYAEKLGRSANSFDELYESLQAPYRYIDQLLIELLDEKIKKTTPLLVAISVPFPGNLFSAFRIAQWIKKNYSHIQLAMGGGFANTELRSLADPRVFEFFDFVSLDDGELPIECIIDHVTTHAHPNEAILKRTFMLRDEKVILINNCAKTDYAFADTGTPDYSDLLLDQYISVLEVVNPMHRLWSDGRWNKLTIAHGCYWGKCTFCDISLDYIKNYEPLAASLICDRMEKIIDQTGQHGFHFVDEAAPPARMRDLALEILRRKLVVSWWTNIRFEKNFTPDLCRLLKASGCIAVTGGLEVASDRLLQLIQKGVTVSQVARVCNHFTKAGIMVHAYLMYGFPTQTAQETIDSLEMVRQLFKSGVIQSGYWHQFAMTVHSPVGVQPEQFKIKKVHTTIGRFANNDVIYDDPLEIDHDQYTYGLKKSILNFMHGLGYDYKLQDWFEFKIPKSRITTDYILKAIREEEKSDTPQHARLIWLGALPELQSTATEEASFVSLYLHTQTKNLSIKLEAAQGAWLVEWLKLIAPDQSAPISLKQTKEMYESAGLPYFELFWQSRPINLLRKNGLLAI